MKTGMKRLLLLIGLIIIVSCKNKKPEHVYTLAYKKEIFEIVKTIIQEHKLNKENQDSIFIKPILYSFRIFQDDTTKYPQLYFTYKGHPSLYINKILGSTVNNEIFFNEEDSLALLSQSEQDSIILDSTFFNSLKHYNINEMKLRNKIYYSFTIPLFSKDKKRAYINVDYNCPGCGYGLRYFLKKKNNKWMIIDIARTWIQ